LCMWCAWWGCWRGAFGVCIPFLSVQVLGAPRDLLHPELTKHTYFLHFCYRPCPFQQNVHRLAMHSHELFHRIPTLPFDDSCAAQIHFRPSVQPSRPVYLPHLHLVWICLRGCGAVHVILAHRRLRPATFDAWPVLVCEPHKGQREAQRTQSQGQWR
jgi:hypothetical protein